MRETIVGFKTFVERYKYVLAIAALMGGPSLVTLGAAMTYYDDVIEDIYTAHQLETSRFQAEVDAERVINRGMLTEMLGHMSNIADRLGIAATQVEDAAETAAKAAASIPETPTTMEIPNETHSDNSRTLEHGPGCSGQRCQGSGGGTGLP